MVKRLGGGAAIVVRTPDAAAFCHGITIQQPKLERFGHSPDYRTAAGRHDVIENCSPRGCAMRAFDLAVGFGKSQMIEGQTIMLDQGMFF